MDVPRIIREDMLGEIKAYLRSRGCSVEPIEDPGNGDKWRRLSYEVFGYRWSGNICRRFLSGYLLPAQNGHYIANLDEGIQLVLSPDWE